MKYLLLFFAVSLLGLSARADEILRMQGGLSFKTCKVQDGKEYCGSSENYKEIEIPLVAENAWATPRGSYVVKKEQDGYEVEATIYGAHMPGLIQGDYHLSITVKTSKKGEPKSEKVTQVGEFYLKDPAAIPFVTFYGPTINTKKSESFTPVIYFSPAP